MESILSDLRLAVRGLAKSPGFTAVAVLTLALGIGASSAIFSVVDAVLLTPLPYERPDELVMLREASGFSSMVPMSPAEVLGLREASNTVTAIEAFDMVDLNVQGERGPERVEGARVTFGFFELLGVRAAHGRLFNSTQDDDGVVVLSHAFWQRHFGGADDAVGETLRMNWSAAFGPQRPLGRTFTVIGVLPAGFISPMGTRELWVPFELRRPAEEDNAFRAHYLFPFARLRPGATIEQTVGEMSGILQAAVNATPDGANHPSDVGATVVALSERAVSRVRTALWALMGAVGFVLLIACANVASLLLTRSTVRQREIALRSALGASRGRLLRQLLAESLVLSAAGALLGLGLAWAGVRILTVLQPPGLPRLDEITIDGPVLAFTMVLTGLAGLVFGLVPAWAGLRGGLAPRLRDGDRGTDGRASRLRGVLVVSEVALAVVLLAGSGLLIRSFANLRHVDLGLDADNVLSFMVALPPLSYAEAHQRQAFHREALEKIAALPEVESAARINALPLGFFSTASPFDVVGRPAAEGERRHVAFRVVSPGYFDTLRIPLLAGEPLTDADVAWSSASDDGNARPTVAVVNKVMAERFWPDGDVLGSRLTLGPNDPVRIVGVVGDVRQAGPAQTPRPTIYLPAGGGRSAGYVVRSAGGRRSGGRRSGDPAALQAVALRAVALRAVVERVIRTIDPEQPIHSVQPLLAGSDLRLSRPRFNAFLLTLFAVLALVLSAVGIFGVLSFSVSRRTREIGVRMALGATAGDVLALIVGQGMRLAVLGLVLGLAGAAGLTRFIDSLLYGVKAWDPTTFVLISATLLAVALAAVLVPARRATRVEPVTALRYE